MRSPKLLIVLAVATSGCASHIETVKVDPKTLQVIGPGVRGVIYYDPMLVKLRYEFTQLIDKERGLIGTSDDGSCLRTVQKEEIVTLPDYRYPKAILHKPLLFSAAEFGVTLNNGMLVSVALKSTPQTAPVLEQIVAASTAGVLAAPAVAGCNSGPVIGALEPVSF